MIYGASAPEVLVMAHVPGVSCQPLPTRSRSKAGGAALMDLSGIWHWALLVPSSRSSWLEMFGFSATFSAGGSPCGISSGSLEKPAAAGKSQAKQSQQEEEHHFWLERALSPMGASQEGAKTWWKCPGFSCVACQALMKPWDTGSFSPGAW